MNFVDGTHLLITFRGSSTLGEVLLASRDGSTLMLRFEGVLGPYHQLMPLVWVGDGYREIDEGNYVGLLSLVELSPTFQSRKMRVWRHRRVSPKAMPSGLRDGDVA